LQRLTHYPSKQLFYHSIKCRFPTSLSIGTFNPTRHAPFINWDKCRQILRVRDPDKAPPDRQWKENQQAFYAFFGE
jgi:hypothetical protein